MFAALLTILIAGVFTALLVKLVLNLKYLDILVIMLGIVSVTIGEAMNLFVFKMAVYKGCSGIPLYIILGGALVSWGIYKSAFFVQKKFNKDCIFLRLIVIFLISVILPVIEIIGLKSGLWYWRRPVPILSLNWFQGVWQFYFLFIVCPAIVAQVFIPNCNLKASKTGKSLRGSCC